MLIAGECRPERALIVLVGKRHVNSPGAKGLDDVAEAMNYAQLERSFVIRRSTKNKQTKKVKRQPFSPPPFF